MGVRESLEKNKPLAFALAGAFIIAAVGVVIWSNSSGIPAPLKTAYYSDDDGTSYFVDDINKIYPFDHNGKQALRADVFQCSDGKQFVGLIYRFTDAGRREMEGYLSNKIKDPQGLARLGIEHRGMQVKPVGGDDHSWTLADDNTTERLQGSVKCPGGTAKLVTP